MDFTSRRRKTRQVKVGSLTLGGGAPITIQAMCSKEAKTPKAIISQILQFEKEGCDLVRIAVPNLEIARAIPEIKKKIHIPLVADIHFDFRLAIEAINNGADKIRINPGNIGNVERVEQILAAARKYKTALRLGVNSGSLETDLLEKFGRPSSEALVASALRWVKIFEKNKFKNFVISIKSSGVRETVEAYEMIAKKCNYPLHLGVTEAGIPPYGSLKSAIGIGALLLLGIGDTIRVSLSSDDPVEQVRVAHQILKSVGLYNKEPEIIACPSCGRTEIDVIALAKEIEKRVAKIKKPLKIAVMGCTVNGPGEAREADFGIAGGRGQGAIFKKGKIIKWIPEAELVDEFMKIIEESL
ncbi:MAG: flavodoxin-dependent (E)-4-hydroxy-3-methylbut-2-enyl-diphosphate synthase [Patescibacteria group bacterium]